MRVKLTITFLLLIGLMYSYYVTKSKNNNIILTPINLNKNHICANDSMIIIDYKGPKAQIIWNDNTRSFYCEVREAFYDSTDKIKSRNIKGFFVQDFSNLEWDSYNDKWEVAENMYYVIDSDMDGAMGLTYVPFSNIESAKLFNNKYHGKILHYTEINKEVLTNSNMLLKDRIIF